MPPREDFDIDWCVRDPCFKHFASSMGALVYFLGVTYTLCNRVPGRLALYTHVYMVLLLASMGITAFLYHALELEVCRTGFYGAQYWTLFQVTVWSVWGLYFPYRFWSLSLALAVVLAVLVPDDSRPGGDIILVAIMLSLTAAGLIYQEFVRSVPPDPVLGPQGKRRRVCSLCVLVLGVGLWVTARICASDLSLRAIGQIGFGLVHVLQTMLLLYWHEFWIQQERDYLQPVLPCLRSTAATLA